MTWSGAFLSVGRFHNYLTSITISSRGKEKCLGVAVRNNGFFPFFFPGSPSVNTV